MIYFNSDYLEGAHPALMAKLNETNMVQTVGYGEDEYCAAARVKIQNACQAPEADVHFLVGGTQTNTTVIAAVLRPWQGVLCAVSGHINCHEAGAIESTGHKVITLPTTNGKITAQQVQEYVEWHRNDESTEHIVQPGMVYISYPTEGGTLYSKAELTELYDVCRRYGLPLFIDGARLGYGVMADGADLTLPEIAHLCDVFYIGGTKNGMVLRNYRKNMGTGSIDAYQLLMQIEGTPCLPAKVGVQQVLSLDKFFGQASANLTYKSAEMSQADMDKLGITAAPAFSYGKLQIKCTKPGVAKIKIKAMAGSSSANGEMSGMEITKEFAIIARAVQAGNGGWL